MKHIDTLDNNVVKPLFNLGSRVINKFLPSNQLVFNENSFDFSGIIDTNQPLQSTLTEYNVALIGNFVPEFKLFKYINSGVKFLQQAFKAGETVNAIGNLYDATQKGNLDDQQLMLDARGSFQLQKYEKIKQLVKILSSENSAGYDLVNFAQKYFEMSQQAKIYLHRILTLNFNNVQQKLSSNQSVSFQKIRLYNDRIKNLYNVNSYLNEQGNLSISPYSYKQQIDYKTFSQSLKKVYDNRLNGVQFQQKTLIGQIIQSETVNKLVKLVDQSQSAEPKKYLRIQEQITSMLSNPELKAITSYIISDTLKRNIEDMDYVKQQLGNELIKSLNLTNWEKAIENLQKIKELPQLQNTVIEKIDQLSLSQSLPDLISNIPQLMGDVWDTFIDNTTTNFTDYLFNHAPFLGLALFSVGMGYMLAKTTKRIWYHSDYKERNQEYTFFKGIKKDVKKVVSDTAQTLLIGACLTPVSILSSSFQLLSMARIVKSNFYDDLLTNKESKLLKKFDKVKQNVNNQIQQNKVKINDYLEKRYKQAQINNEEANKFNYDWWKDKNDYDKQIEELQYINAQLNKKKDDIEKQAKELYKKDIEQQTWKQNDSKDQQQYEIDSYMNDLYRIERQVVIQQLKIEKDEKLKAEQIELIKNNKIEKKNIAPPKLKKEQQQIVDAVIELIAPPLKKQQKETKQTEQPKMQQSVQPVVTKNVSTKEKIEGLQNLMQVSSKKKNKIVVIDQKEQQQQMQQIQKKIKK